MRMPVTRKAGAAIGTLLCFAVLLAQSSFHTTAQSQKNTAEFERLAQKASREGTVPVIVHLDVPGIRELTAASLSIRATDNTRATAAAVVEADGALGAAVNTATDSVLSELRGTGYTANHRYRSIPFVALRASAQAIAALQSSQTVLGIEEDVLIPLNPAELSPEKPLSPTSQPQLQNTVNIIGASTAWGWGFTGQGWYVAIIDTGIRRTHQFFTGKTIVEACFAMGADGVGGAGDCPNGQSTMTGTGSAAHHPSTYSGYDHGTHVSGIATGNFGSLSGVAKNANILAVQVFSKIGSGVSTWNSDSMAGLDYTYSLRGTYRIASANMSLGGSTIYTNYCDGEGRKASIDNLRSAGIATAVATGNAGQCGVSAPACISSTVSVGASTDADVDADFSNWHWLLQRVYAPGVEIYSSTGVSDSSYSSWNGTSMATPHVAGAWALMKQVVPNGSVTDLLAALRNTGVNVTSTCDGNRIGIPRIRVDRAIASLPRFTLTIQASAFGTTDPAPGAYGYAPGTQVAVTAIPADSSDFVAWSGAATGTTNPVTITLDADKTLAASFQYIFAPSATGQHVVNRSFSQIEYVNVLRWTPSASNQGLNITKYRIYLVSGGSRSQVGEVPAGPSSFEYLHRNAGPGAAQYNIVAVTGNNREGAPATVTVQ